jgi:hypothetical protein
MSTPVIRSRQIVLAATLCFATAISCNAQTTSPSRFLKWTYQDACGLAVRVGERSPLLVLGSAAVLLPSSRLDEIILEEVQEGYTGSVATYLDISNEFGGPKVVLPVVGVFAASLLGTNTRFQDAAFTSMESLVYAGIITGGLKMVFGRLRPESGAGSYRLDPFSGNSSFPSGHTTAAFAIVTPWVLYYRNGATYALFVLSTSTAVARIARDKHWPTDVLAGSAIGFFTARFLSNRHLADRSGSPAITMSPVVDYNGSGVSIAYRFR